MSLTPSELQPRPLQTGPGSAELESGPDPKEAQTKPKHTADLIEQYSKTDNEEVL